MRVTGDHSVVILKVNSGSRTFDSKSSQREEQSGSQFNPQRREGPAKIYIGHGQVQKKICYGTRVEGGEMFLLAERNLGIHYRCENPASGYDMANTEKWSSEKKQAGCVRWGNDRYQKALKVIVWCPCWSEKLSTAPQPPTTEIAVAPPTRNVY